MTTRLGVPPDVEAQQAARSRRGGGPATAGRLLVVPVVTLLVWSVLAAVVGPVAVASPAATLTAALEGLREGWLTMPVVDTLTATLLGFLLATAVGLWLGFMLGMSRFWSDVLEGPLLWLYSIPKVTLFPLFLLFLGLGTSSVVAFGAFHGVFPLTLFLLSGIRGIPPVRLKVAKLYRLARWTTFTDIVLPETLPAMVMGIRYCFSLTFLGVILAEMFAARSGAGYELMQAISLNNPARIFAIAVTLVLLALVVNMLLLMLQGVVDRRRGGTLTDATMR